MRRPTENLAVMNLDGSGVTALTRYADFPANYSGQSAM